MGRTSPIPALLRGHPYAAAVFVGSAAVSVIGTLYALTFAFATGPDRLPTWVVMCNLAVAASSLAVAGTVAAGRILSPRGLERAAAAVLGLAYATVLAEVIASPSRAEITTARCYLVVVGAGVVIRRRRVLLGWCLGALTTWAVTISLVDAPSFSPRAWWSSWVIAVAVAFAMNAVATTERDVEYLARRAAESSSGHDTLTGLTNRRGSERRAAQLLALAQRRGEAIWCAFLDVDHFKSVNDLLGHDAGDEVLVAVAAALRMVSRAADVPTRWGGDEFLVIGLGEPPDELDMERRIIDQLRMLDSEILRLWTPGVTVGVASAVGHPGGAVAELITAADHRMYQRRETKRSQRARTG